MGKDKNAIVNHMYNHRAHAELALLNQTLQLGCPVQMRLSSLFRPRSHKLSSCKDEPKQHTLICTNITQYCLCSSANFDFQFVTDTRKEENTGCGLLNMHLTCKKPWVGF